jgi:hypothetical protein
MRAAIQRLEIAAAAAPRINKNSALTLSFGEMGDVI